MTYECSLRTSVVLAQTSEALCILCWFSFHFSIIKQFFISLLLLCCIRFIAICWCKVISMRTKSRKHSNEYLFRRTDLLLFLAHRKGSIAVDACLLLSGRECVHFVTCIKFNVLAKRCERQGKAVLNWILMWFVTFFFSSFLLQPALDCIFDVDCCNLAV